MAKTLGVVATPVDSEGAIDPAWGRAERVAIVNTEAGAIRAWSEYHVGWGRARQEGRKGEHHARIAQFLRAHQVATILCHHLGPGMATMVERLGIACLSGQSGSARHALTEALEDRGAIPVRGQ